MKVELVRRWRVLAFMTNAAADVPTADAEHRIDTAVDAIRSSLAEVAPRPGLLDRLSAATRGAPIPSLAIAFLTGVILARR